MKKLLNLITAITLTSAVATSVIACVANTIPWVPVNKIGPAQKIIDKIKKTAINIAYNASTDPSQSTNKANIAKALQAANPSLTNSDLSKLTYTGTLTPGTAAKITATATVDKAKATIPLQVTMAKSPAQQIIFKTTNNNQISDFGLNPKNNDLYFTTYKKLSSQGDASDGRAFVLPFNKNKVTALNSLDQVYPYLMAFSENGDTYIGTYKGGIYKIKANSYQPLQDTAFPTKKFDTQQGAWASAMETDLTNNRVNVGFDYNDFRTLNTSTNKVTAISGDAAAFNAGSHVDYIKTSPKGDIYVVSSSSGAGVGRFSGGKWNISELTLKKTGKFFSTFGSNYLILFDSDNNAFLKNNVAFQDQIYEISSNGHEAIPLINGKIIKNFTNPNWDFILSTMTMPNSNLIYFSAFGENVLATQTVGGLYELIKTNNVWLTKQVSGLSDVKIKYLHTFANGITLIDTETHGVYYISPTQQEVAKKISGIPDGKAIPTLFNGSNQPSIFQYNAASQDAYMIHSGQVYQINLKTFQAKAFNQNLNQTVYAEQLIYYQKHLAVAGQSKSNNQEFDLWLDNKVN